MYVIPKPDRKVPDPVAKDYLPPEGRNVEKSQYWLRRVLDGDVEEVDPPSVETKSKGGAK